MTPAIAAPERICSRIQRTGAVQHVRMADVSPLGCPTPGRQIRPPISWFTSAMSPFEVGDKVDSLPLQAIDGARIYVPDRQRLVHLQFRRFAGCPICHLHIRSIVQRLDEIGAAGVLEAVVFHSEIQALQKYQSDLPFAVIADPERSLYSRFGCSHRWVRSPTRAHGPRLPGGLFSNAPLKLAWVLAKITSVKPADFLIAPDGTLLAAKYGSHANDQWSIDEVIELGSRYRLYARAPKKRGK